MTQETTAPIVYGNEITEIKGEIKSMDSRIDKLERKTDRHDEQIKAINKTLDSINENTTWIKRTITAALITAVCTGVIGGSIAIVFTVFKGGS
ncbi:hemolysin XhlA [Cytobacillus firmus]|uniref:Hemolysin XhlA n=2 Tax=Cytobacillus TaxID=2675230 RepID=A0A366JNK1_CYTFI|nr:MULTISPECIES: hemolysin XhlA family protein [Cytobacillus]RBP89405.1 hemolysin XhlA [Cytobacillus firmus]TDX47368.1 hemolysin XhlA [Cytobacillus oceanisediminis]